MPEGRILPDDELERLGAKFPDAYFGQLIFLVEEGVLIVPSDMGKETHSGNHTGIILTRLTAMPHFSPITRTFPRTLREFRMCTG